MSLSILTGKKLFWITIALSAAVFMQVLDSTIANVALPTISGNLGAATSQGTWVITSFSVSNAISIPITGWLSKYFGEVKIFIYSTLLFIISSWLCGLSTSLPMLIFFRLIQGLVAGPMIPLSQSLLVSSYPIEKRSFALGMWSLVIVVAPICGPILGGLIVDNWHWGWIFFINIPFGILSIVILKIIFKNKETETIKQKIDKIGLFLLVIGIGCFQMMLDRGKELDWFNSNEIIILSIISLISLTYLVFWELGEDSPLIDFRLFKSRNFTVGVLGISLGFMLHFGLIVLIPMLLQTRYGYTAIWAGLVAAPIGIFPILISPILGKYGNNLDMRILVSISFFVYAICFYWRSKFSPQMEFIDFVLPQFLQGFAVATFFLPLTTICLSQIPLNQIASASSLSNFFRTLSGGVGASFVTTLWDRRSMFHYERLTESVTNYSETTQEWFRNMSERALNNNDALQNNLIGLNINNQAYIMGANDIFFMGSIIILFLIIIVWFAKPPFSSSYK